MEYWWEGSVSTAIPPTSIPDVVGQHVEIGCITFREVFVILFRKQKGLIEFQYTTQWNQELCTAKDYCDACDECEKHA